MNKDEIIAARNAQLLGSVPQKDRVDALDGFLKRLYGMKGYGVADPSVQPEIDIAVKELDSKLATRWSGLTLGEVWLALEAGAIGEFGKDTRLYPLNYITWLNEYTKSPERREVIADQNRNYFGDKKRVEPARQLSEADQQRKNDEADIKQLRIEWGFFKAEGKLDMICDGCAECLCNYLQRIGKLNPKPETLEKARHRGELRYNRKYMKGGFWSDLARPKYEDNVLRMATKHELLALYFESLRDRGLELTL